MSNLSSQSFNELKDQIAALQQLLLAHILAFDAADRDATNATLLIAAGQADHALANSRPVVAHRIAAMIEEIEQCRD